MNNIHRNKESQNEEHYFCAVGEEDYTDDSGNPRTYDGTNSKVAAKIVFNKRPRQITTKDIYKSYFIKVNPSLEVYDPIRKSDAVMNKTTNFFVHRICKNEWVFKEVDSVVFGKYLNYLKTGNSKIIKDIQRDLK